MASGTPPGERLIKRYGNRKLYDPRGRRYVTLEQVGRMVAGGEEVRVVDQRTGDDLTTVVLAQVILEGVKERTASVPRQVLGRLIRLGTPAARSSIRGSVDASARAAQEAERIVGALLRRGRLTLDEGVALRHDIARTLQGLVSEAQQGLEGRLRGLLERAEREEGPVASLQALKERLMAFDTYLSVPRARTRGRAASRKRRRKT